MALLLSLRALAGHGRDLDRHGADALRCRAVSVIGMLTVSAWPAAIRGIVWSTLMSLPSVIAIETADVGLLRLALVLDRHVEGQLVR